MVSLLSSLRTCLLVHIGILLERMDQGSYIVKHMVRHFHEFSCIYACLIACFLLFVHAYCMVVVNKILNLGLQVPRATFHPLVSWWGYLLNGCGYHAALDKKDT